MNEVRERLVEPLATAQVIIGLILLIACANVATLLLARSEERKKEMAVRLSLGAGRWRLVRQLLTESVLLALVGGGIGLILAQWGSDALFTLLPTYGGSAAVLRLGPDPTVLVFTLFVSLLTGVLFGLVPAYRTSGVTPGPSLKTSVLGGARSRLGIARALVVAQVALSLVLLVAAGLLLRSLRNAEAVDPGFDPEGLFVFRIDPTLNGYHGEPLSRLYDQVLERLEGLPGVTNVSLMPHVLISGSGWWDDARLQEDKKVETYISAVDRHFLATMKIPLLFGRNLTPQDDAGAPRVALVNEAFARSAFEGDSPIGRRFKFGHRESVPEIEIVGVFRNSKDVSLKRETQATVLLPFRQQMDDVGAMSFLLRHHRSSQSLIGMVREAVRQVDANLPLYDVKTMTDQIDASLIQERQFARLSILCGALAVVLTSIGLYGILSASVSRRTQEIGLRMALGAQRADISRSVMKEMLLVGAGIVFGLVAAWALTRWLSSLLFQLSALDPLTLSSAILLMILIAAAAVSIPARRASRVDPMEALRFE
jgi:predicted permease